MEYLDNIRCIAGQGGFIRERPDLYAVRGWNIHNGRRHPDQLYSGIQGLQCTERGFNVSDSVWCGQVPGCDRPEQL